MKAAVLALLCAPLAGCYVNLYGVQTTGGGSTATVTASQVSGAAKFSGGRVAFSSGQVPPRGAPGGHVSLGKEASAVLITGVILADFINYVRGAPAPRALPADERIMDTCSCFRQEGDEIRVTKQW
jgi:hypothetical protein